MSVSSDPGSAPVKRYGMVIDVNRCVGCQTCTIACKHANDTLPEVQWRSVLDVEQGQYPDVERFFLVVGCQHCADPPCVPVCPSGATYQRDDGLVVMDYDLCIGCGYCAVACPYQARTIAHEMKSYYRSETIQEKHVAHEERIGVAQKCTFCIDRVDEAEARGLVPGVDLEVTPACAASCIAQAIKFGDFADPGSIVSTLVRERGSFQINDFLNTDPQIKYLYEVPNAIPGDTAAEPDDEELRDPNNPLAGRLQEFWDIRAAMNFTMGGMGSGLIVVSALLWLLDQIALSAATYITPVAGISIAIGLFFVFLEIGRKLRALNVMLRPDTSWMTREVYVVIVLYPLLALVWYQPGITAIAALGIAGAAFLYCQARIINAAKAIPAWRAPLVPALFCVTGLSEGSGLFALLSALISDIPVSPILVTFMSCSALLMGILSHLYISSASNNHLSPLAIDALTRIVPYHLGGLALAIALLVLWLANSWAPAAWIAGAILVAAGITWKMTVILRACHQQGFVLPKVPKRGAGARAAPHRFGGLATR